jgi:hypothetical protein
VIATSTELLALPAVGLGLAVVAAIVVPSLRIGIAPMPSGALARRTMLDLVGTPRPGDSIADLGSGWGHLAIACARRHPACEVVGYERSWLPWIVSVIAARCCRLHNLRLLRQDFLAADLSRHDVLLCYLFRDGMRRLGGKLAGDDCRPLLVSHTFALPGRDADRVVELGDLYRSRLWVYAGRRCREESPGR